MGIPKSLAHYSIDKDVDDLIADLEQALDHTAEFVQRA